MDNRLIDSGDFPKVVLLDTTAYCNLECPNCGHPKMSREKGNMSLDLFCKVIDEIADKSPDTRVWMVFFGEGLILRNNLFQMINYAKENGLSDVVLNSNGFLLDHWSRRGIIDAGLDAIYIGIDAITPSTYAKVRVGSNYGIVHDNVKALLAMKPEKPEVFVQFVEMEENQNEREEFVRYWSGLGATVKVRPKVTFTGAAPSFNVSNIERYPCHWAMQTMSILWDGRVCLCACDYDGQFIAGNVRNHSIQEVWIGGLKEIRGHHLRGEWSDLPEVCYQCNDWQMAIAEYVECQ